MYGFLAYRLASEREAEDLTQLTFERAFKAWSRFNPARASAKTWFISIARNALIDRARRARLRPEHPVAEPPETALQDAELDSKLGIEPNLERALAGLKGRDREVLALRFGADLEATEIATALNLSAANVHQILSRSLRRLRDELAGSEAELRSTASAELPS